MGTHAEARDIISVKSLSLSGNIGPDCWGRSAPQPLRMDIEIVMAPLSLEKAGHSDDVNDTINYGSVSKNVLRIFSLGQVAFPCGMFTAATLATTAVSEVVKKSRHNQVQEYHIALEAPKAILLADGLRLSVLTRVTRSGPKAGEVVQDVWWSVKDLRLAVIIGVNPAERLAKQPVIINIEIYQKPRALKSDWATVVPDVIKALEASEYLTLEKFVMEALRVVCLSSECVDTATVRAQKPSAITLAHSSCVEITRSRQHFLDAQSTDA
ncbi:hypothetical protein OE88DRAFT_1661129 [Heliocybe sulcata]|uniref:dihydroneopterin aldolase n=1 Tax=Heliocybe sulcata TaxID=5364 RepID=A0A5C3MZY6_9AGAM|nr:hypothetical protein OE88DRAFT_1661129 [Heliocybe sulcata]